MKKPFYRENEAGPTRDGLRQAFSGYHHRRLGFEVAKALQDLTSQKPDSELAGKPPRGLNSDHPAKTSRQESAEQVEGDACDTPSSACRITKGQNVCTGFVEPPRQEILLLKPIGRHRVIHDRRWLVLEFLTGGKKPMTKLAVFAFLGIVIIGLRSQINAKSSIFFEDCRSKGHVGAEGKLGERARFRAQIENDKGSFPIPLADGKPGRRRDGPFGKNASS